MDPGAIDPGGTTVIANYIQLRINVREVEGRVRGFARQAVVGTGQRVVYTANQFQTIVVTLTTLQSSNVIIHYCVIDLNKWNDAAVILLINTATDTGTVRVGRFGRTSRFIFSDSNIT